LKSGWETVAAPIFTTLLYLAVFALALGPAHDTPEGRRVYAYIVPGLVMFAAIQRAAEDCVFTVTFDKLEGIIVDLLMPPLTGLEFVLGHLAMAVIGAVGLALPILGLSFWLFGMSVADPLLALAYLVVGAATAAAMALIVALWAQKWDHVGAFLGFLVVPLVFLSGTFTPIENLALTFGGIDWQGLLWISPFAHLIDGFRAATTGPHALPVWLTLPIASGFAVALTAAAAKLYTVGWRLKP
jgi:ABC-2 type transport system permease protein